MRNNYTRQRQGRDFRTPDEEAKARREKQSVLAHLDECIAEAERNKTPIDGREPDGAHPEKER